MDSTSLQQSGMQIKEIDGFQHCENLVSQVIICSKYVTYILPIIGKITTHDTFFECESFLIGHMLMFHGYMTYPHHIGSVFLLHMLPMFYLCIVR